MAAFKQILMVEKREKVKVREKFVEALMVLALML
jgi:ribosomal protein L21